MNSIFETGGDDAILKMIRVDYEYMYNSHNTMLSIPCSPYSMLIRSHPLSPSHQLNPSLSKKHSLTSPIRPLTILHWSAATALAVSSIID